MDTAKSGISAMGGLTAQIVTDFVTQATSRGLDIGAIIKKLGIDPEKLIAMIGKSPVAAPTIGAATRETSAPVEPKSGAPDTEEKK